MISKVEVRQVTWRAILDKLRQRQQYFSKLSELYLGLGFLENPLLICASFLIDHQYKKTKEQFLKEEMNYWNQQNNISPQNNHN